MLGELMAGRPPKRQDGAHDRNQRRYLTPAGEPFGDSGPQPDEEPLLMALHADYYELIWQG
jgi:hypothetical protein